MRPLRAAGLLLVATLLAFSAPAGAAKSRTDKILLVPQPIWTLAMDGPRVAYMSAGRVHVWNVLTGTASVVKATHAGNSKDYGEVAIAGARVAWITRLVSGESKQTTERLYTAPVGGWAHAVGPAYRHNANPGVGATATGLVGAGDLLAVSTWNTTGAVSTEQRLSLVTPTGLQPIASGPNAVVSESADGGHIAVLSPAAAPNVDIYSAAGTLLHAVAPGTAREIALSGNRLVVLTRAQRLKVYNWTTGALLHTWRVAAESPARAEGGGNLAVSGQLAVVAGAGKLHLLDLTTGKDVVIARASDSRYANRDAAIGPRGLVYVVNYPNTGGSPRHGKLVFVPRARLLSRLRADSGKASRIFVRLPESVAVRQLPAAAHARPTHRYGWPIRPFGVKHRIRSGFGDPRFGRVQRNFHFGIDIPARDGTPVYAVSPGIVYLSPDRVAVLTTARPGHRTGFTYWHITPAVPEDSFVGLHALIGWIKPGLGHVHFAEIEHNRYVNPLRPGALTPAPNLRRPTIDSITVEPIGPTAEADGAVDGTIRVVVETYVRPKETPLPPWQGSVISPSLIRWRLLAHGTPVSEWRTAVDFRNWIPPNGRYGDIYAPAARPDHPDKPGTFLYYLARKWNAASLPHGTYTIKVVAYSTGRQKTTATFPLQIAKEMKT